MRVLVTGGCGFIGSHFVKRLVAGGDDVVVLDKLTYSGNPANIAGVDCELVEGDIAEPDAVERPRAGCEAVVNFAAESHVDRSILEAGDFIRTDVYGTHVLLEWARERRALASSRSRRTRSTGTCRPGVSSREDDPLRPSSPYSASKAGGDLQVLAYVRTFGINASITRGANTYGSYQYPGEAHPSLRHERVGRPLPSPSTGTVGSGASGCMPRTTAPRSTSSSAKASPAASTTWAARSARTSRSFRRISSSPARTVARAPRGRPAGPRPPLLPRLVAARGRSAGGPSVTFEDGLAEYGRLVPGEPGLVGADQVRRVPRLLPPPVRRPARVAGLAACTVPWGHVRGLTPDMSRRAMAVDKHLWNRGRMERGRARGSATIRRGREALFTLSLRTSTTVTADRGLRNSQMRRLSLLTAVCSCPGLRSGRERKDAFRPERPGLGPRRRDEPVGRVRPGEAGEDVPADPGALLPGHDGRGTPGQWIRVLLGERPDIAHARLGGRLHSSAHERTGRALRSVTSEQRPIRVEGLTGTFASPVTLAPTGGSLLQLGAARYRGTIVVSVVGGRLRAVNHVGLEHYVRGVVASESPCIWPAAALQAQAVAARSYALASGGHCGGGLFCPNTSDQVYSGADAETGEHERRRCCDCRAGRPSRRRGRTDLLLREQRRAFGQPRRTYGARPFPTCKRARSGRPEREQPEPLVACPPHRARASQGARPPADTQ